VLLWGPPGSLIEQLAIRIAQNYSNGNDPACKTRLFFNGMAMGREAACSRISGNRTRGTSSSRTPGAG